MRHASLAPFLIAGWALLYGPGGRNADWRQVGVYGTESRCDYARVGEVERATLERIGGVLASQPVDNPLRRDAYRRAYERVEPQYRCVQE